LGRPVRNPLNIAEEACYNDVETALDVRGSAVSQPAARIEIVS